MNYPVLLLRSWARKFGLLRAINSVRFLGRNSQSRYEERFSRALQSAIREGDLVWDVGANLGYYTSRFLQWVGSTGSVVAFEPAPECYKRLSEQLKQDDRVTLEEMALGAENGEVQMYLADDPTAATHRISETALPAANDRTENRVTKVRIVSGDAYWKASGRTPNVIKIDVEGFESHVLDGMSELAKSPDVRALFCEIHFGLLDQAGDRAAPLRIEKHLRSCGFRTTWVDASHLQAVRTP